MCLQSSKTCHLSISFICLLRYLLVISRLGNLKQYEISQHNFSGCYAVQSMQNCNVLSIVLYMMMMFWLVTLCGLVHIYESTWCLNPEEQHVIFTTMTTSNLTYYVVVQNLTYGPSVHILYFEVLIFCFNMPQNMIMNQFFYYICCEKVLCKGTKEALLP
jgi:hypothetical protein